MMQKLRVGVLMGKLILVTGGARSGKSRFAEEYLRTNFQDVLYIATAIPYDDEMKQRIKKHQDQRPSSWPTYEGHKQLENVIGPCENSAILLDCVTILITNLMFDIIGAKDITECDSQAVETEVMGYIDHILEATKAYKGTIVMVTNEVGQGLVPEHALSRFFRDMAGRVNQRIAQQADQVYMAVSGIPVKIKGE